MDRERVIDSLDALRRRDKGLTLFGSEQHGYKLNPPIALAEIERFESEKGVHLPDDYRLFVTQIGNGGAGPYYGVFAFGYQDDGSSSCRWEDASLVGDLAKPFPHEDRWNLPESFWAQKPDTSEDTPLEEVDRLYADWDARIEADYWNPSLMNGSIPICHVGCALRHWLVINGKCKGQVWADERADEGGIYPLQDNDGRIIGFDQWYGDWLDAALREFGISQSTLDQNSDRWMLWRRRQRRG